MIKFVGSASRIHPSQNGDSIAASSVKEFAEEIAITKKLRAPVQRIFAGIISDDAASVDDDALDACALPIIAPPWDIIAGNVEFGDVGLAPAQAAAVPGNGIGL